jgi:pimeloyl-[acyl-carrier protein] methyl ester esterase
VTLPIYHDVYECRGARSHGELVLVHGWGMNSHVWDAIMPELLSRFRVTVADLPGLGRSPLPGGPLSLESLASRLLEISPPRACWMGWSLGGAVAAVAAFTEPQRIDTLVTVSTNPKFLASADWPRAMSCDLFAEFEALLEEDSQGTLIRFLSLQCKGSEAMRDDIRFLRERVFHDGLPAHRALREGLSILATQDLRQVYSRLSVPHLAIFGQQDALVPAAVVPAVEALHPDIRSALIGGAAHIPFVSHPDLVARALEDFLGDC